MNGNGILPLALDGIRLDIGGHAILDGIDATFASGTRTVILGANGAGKSVLLRICHGLIKPTAGAVRWASGEIRPRAQAMVFQRPVVLRRSVLANIEYGLRLAGVGAIERRERAASALARVGLSAIGTRSARVLSGGEQQRLALARAWALEPSILFLDEPTANLDPSAKKEVEALLAAFIAEGMTIVMSTHNLGQAKRLATRIVYMDGGRIGADLPTAQFFAERLGGRADLFLKGDLSWSLE